MANNPPPKRSRTSNPNLANDNDSTHPQIVITPRTHEFTPSTWWMVDIETPGITQGATPLIKRCMRHHNWDLPKSRSILKAYRQFLFLKKHYKDWDATLLSPSFLVDQMWHQHILDVSNYCHDMMLLCGHFVGHDPDGGLDVVAKRGRDLRTREGLEEHFEGEFDREIWGFGDARTEGGDEGRAVNGIDEDNEVVAGDEEGGEDDDLVKVKVWLDGVCRLSDDVKRTSQLSSCLARFMGDRRASERYEFRFNGLRIDRQSSPESLGVGRNETLTLQAHVCKVRGTIFLGHVGDSSDFTIERSSSLLDVLTDFSRSQGRPLAEFKFTYFGDTVDPQLSPDELRVGFSPDDILASLRIVAVLRSRLAQDRETYRHNFININIKDQSGEQTFFRLRRCELMGTVIRAWLNRKGFSPGNIEFKLDGDLVPEYLSPVTLELEEGDVIDANLVQIGC